MFLGTHQPKLDDKGRLILPARFREQLAGGLVITKGQERCLFVFPALRFQEMYQELVKAPLTSKQARDYVRVMLAGAADEMPDKQGRITIPAPLRAYADLRRDLTVVGVGDRAEIWDTGAWERYLAAQEEAFAETAEEIVPGMF